MVLDLTSSVEGGIVENRAKDNVFEARFSTPVNSNLNTRQPI